jgi:hypothetical protein
MRASAMPSPADAEPPDPPVAEHPAGTPAAAPAGPAWRRWVPRRRRPAGDGAAPDADEPAEQPTEAIPVPPRSERPGHLRRRRRRLLTRREEAVYHLGGLAFELYRREMLGEEVMRRRAGEVAMLDDTVRDIDVRLGELDAERRERRARRKADPDPPVGACLECRAPFRAAARFCWQCGAALVPPGVGDEQVTAVIATPPRDPAPGSG